MLFSDFTFLWNNIYKDINNSIKLNSINNILKDFKILNITSKNIVIFTFFNDINMLFDQKDINKIKEIINNNIKTNKNIDIVFQSNYIKNIDVDKNKTLDNFVLNSENRLSFAIAKEISTKNINKLYSPLMIYSKTGLGKSHIINGIVLEYTNHFPKNKIVYYSGETFKEAFIETMKNNTLNKWKYFNTECDLFIIDDIHIIENNENTINEFQSLFDSLYSNPNKPQIVITANKDPENLKGFSNSLKSRLQWGIKLEISSPNDYTKENIIKSIFKKYNIPNNNNIISYLAKICQNNVREIEGQIKTLYTYSTLLDQQIDMNLINKVIGKKTKENNHYSTTDEDILFNVCQYFNINEIDIKSKNRARSIAFPRQIGMYLTKELTNKSLQEIGKIYGGRDHSTVKHSNDKIKKLYKADIKIRNIILHLTKKINNEFIYQ